MEQKVPYAGMQEIYNCACEAWKKKIKGMTQIFEDTVLTDKQVQEMFDAAYPDQKKILKKWLKEVDDIEVDFSNVVIPFPNAKTPEERCLNAIGKAFQIAKTFNGGKKLTWEDRDDYKYFPYKYFNGVSWSALDNCHCRDSADFPVGLAFKDVKSAKKAYELYPEVYDDLLMFKA